MPDHRLDDREMVLALLHGAGISASSADVDSIAAGYAASRRTMLSLYAMAGVRYEVPALTFDPRVECHDPVSDD